MKNSNSQLQKPMMFYSCSIIVFINLLTGLNMYLCMSGLKGVSPRQICAHRHTHSLFSPFLSLSVFLRLCAWNFYWVSLEWGCGWREGGQRVAADTGRTELFFLFLGPCHVMLSFGWQAFTPAKAVWVLHSPWELMSLISCIGSVSSPNVESNAIFLPRDGIADWRVKRHISQIRVASWLLTPWSLSQLSSLELLPYGWCLRKISPHSPSPSAILLIHSIHSYLKSGWGYDPLLCGSRSPRGKSPGLPLAQVRLCQPHKLNWRLAWTMLCCLLTLLLGSFLGWYLPL